MAREWTVKEICDLVEKKFGKRPCWLQIKIALALYAKKDVVGVAATGAGKTLSFWIALLMALADGEDKMVFVVTPLNLLGKQNVETLEKAELSAIAVSGETVIKEPGTFKDIEDGKYRVVIINPELLMGNEHIAKLWTKPHITKRILYSMFDEGHCVSQWNKFRNEYKHVGDLRYLIPEIIPFYVASATLPPAVLLDVAEILRLRHDMTEHIVRSNDRPEIGLMVRGLTFPASSYKDLDFLIPQGYKEGDPPVPKFLIFFDNTKEAEAACRHLRKLLPWSLRKKIKYFHSTMTQAYREEELAHMRDSDIWGLCCTDAFGMGMDLPDIKIVVQWKAPSDLCTLWQHFGRVARSQDQTGTAILLVEKKDMDEERVAKIKRAEKRKKKPGTGTKRKAKGDGNGKGKRPPLVDRNVNRGLEPANAPQAEASESDGDVEMAEVGEAAAAQERAQAESAFRQERRVHYALRDTPKDVGASVRKGKVQAEVEVGSPMDDFINMHLCIICCRRIIPRVYFGNDRTPMNDYLLCDDTTASGCSRCAPKDIVICCNFCRPESFVQYRVAQPEKPQAQSSAKSHVKPFKMTTTDHGLKTALFDWRQQQAVKKFGVMFIRRLGAKFLISDQIVDQLVGCAHSEKPLATIEHLVKETKWRREWAEELGGSLLEVIHTHFPQACPAAAATSTATETSTTASTSTSASPLIADAPSTEAAAQSTGKRKNKCGKCGAKGHISTNSLCPVHLAERAEALVLQRTAPPSLPVPVLPAPQCPQSCPRLRPVPQPTRPVDPATPHPPATPASVMAPPSLPSVYQNMLTQPFSYPVPSTSSAPSAISPHAGPSDHQSPHHLPPSRHL